MSVAGDRARARIRRNRLELEFMLLYGCFGPFQPATEATDELAALQEAELREAGAFIEYPPSVINDSAGNDRDAFVGQFLGVRAAIVPTPPDGFVLAKLWRSVNELRPLGAAPFIDMIKHCRQVDPSFDFALSPVDGRQIDAYLDAFRVHVMPMLDGLMKVDLASLATTVLAILGLQPGDERAAAFNSQLDSFGL